MEFLQWWVLKSKKSLAKNQHKYFKEIIVFCEYNERQSSSKIEHDFRKESVSKIEVIKEHFYQSDQKLLFLIEKKNQKDSDNFRHRHWHFLISRNSQNSIIYTKYVHFWPKNLAF